MKGPFPAEVIRRPDDINASKDGYGQVEVYLRFKIDRDLLASFMGWVCGDDDALDIDGRLLDVRRVKP